MTILWYFKSASDAAYYSSACLTGLHSARDACRMHAVAHRLTPYINGHASVISTVSDLIKRKVGVKQALDSYMH